MTEPIPDVMYLTPDEVEQIEIALDRDPIVHGYPYGIQEDGEFHCNACMIWCQINYPHMLNPEYFTLCDICHCWDDDLQEGICASCLDNDDDY